MDIKELEGYINENEIKRALRYSFKCLYKYDKELICPSDSFGDSDKKNNESGKGQHGSERSVVFRFGYYFQFYLNKRGLFKDYNVDCEYNRNNGDLKRTNSKPNGTMPDIILHKRGSNSYNLLVIEFKGSWNKNITGVENDRKKLKDYTDLSGKKERNDYRFKYGLEVFLEKEKPRIELYQEGRLIKG